MKIFSSHVLLGMLITTVFTPISVKNDGESVPIISLEISSDSPEITVQEVGFQL